MLAIWSLILNPFLNAFSKSSLNIWNFTVHVLLKPGLEIFEHCFTIVWDKCNCAVVWAFFGIAFLWDWNESWHYPVLWPLLSFSNLLAYWLQTFTAWSFRIWNSSNGIPSPQLALFIVILPMAHLTSHSRISGFRFILVVKIFSVQFFCVFLPPLLNVFCFC